MRKTFLPFSRPALGREEIREVVDSLKSGWITTGPKVQKFESDFAEYTGSPYAIAVNSATSGLHLAYLAAGIKPGDEVITSPITFISTVSMMLAVGAKPVLADVNPETLNIDPEQIERRITRRTRAIVPVHFAGLPCDMDRIRAIARRHRLKVIEDAAHALGTEYKGNRVGVISDATVFSFHPIKNITTGEGGMITTANKKWAEQMTLQRFHGMSKTAWKRYSKTGSPLYDISTLGYKYNMMDIQAALGIHQLAKLEKLNRVREQYAQIYRRELAGLEGIRLQEFPDYPFKHCWHLFIMLVDSRKLKIDRDQFIQEMSRRNIGTGVHFTAVHRHSHYRKLFSANERRLPHADRISDSILSLPLYPTMTRNDLQDSIDSVKQIVRANFKRKLL